MKKRYGSVNFVDGRGIEVVGNKRIIDGGGCCGVG